jgi:hypothetical protein
MSTVRQQTTLSVAVSTAVTEVEELPEQRILREFYERFRGRRIRRGRNRRTGILRLKVLREFCNIQEIIEQEQDPIRKGEWIIARDKTIEIWMNLWKNTKKEDDDNDNKFKGIKHELRLREIERMKEVAEMIQEQITIEEEEFSLFEEMNYYIQERLEEWGNSGEEDLDLENVRQVFQIWNQ